MEEKSVETNQQFEMETDDAVDEPAKIALISSEGSRYEVAKDLLLQFSDYFQALTISGMRDANFKELTLECLSDASLREVNNFLLNLQSNEDHFGARDLCCVEKGLEGSFYLQIRSMTDKYLNYLSGQLNESTYERILHFAKKFAMFGTIEKVFAFIFDNFRCIVSKSEILSLSPDEMIRLVESDVVNVDREFDIFDLVVRWTSADESRRQYAELLFSKVRYNLMAVDEKRKASDLLIDLKLKVQTECYGFCTIGTIIAFGEPTFKIIHQCHAIELPAGPLCIYRIATSRLPGWDPCTTYYAQVYSLRLSLERVKQQGSGDKINKQDSEMFDCTTEQWTFLLSIKVPFNNPPSTVLINSSLYSFHFDYNSYTSQNHLSIQTINLKKYLNDNKSSSNTLSDLATYEKLKTNDTDDEGINRKCVCPVLMHPIFSYDTDTMLVHYYGSEFVKCPVTIAPLHVGQNK
ncbi:hypothetical protein HELRODRAFT_164831 [Helobdella robusta]|uniref:BACK domain-containing protein n=1 Tax=Helobdella robusta TaxID=6412 RepID=T1EVV1_HELRO|nr:hypothetical protein HELRODRAFT_164831 [Helobdella robusta]ESN92734.1 hypothetical protein HELRODRAFT_164831 [Helobdella robusta]